MNRTRPLVSVVVPSFNHGAYIYEAITSVLNQSVEQIEVVVVDDCSTDNSRQVIRSLSDRRLQAHFLDENVGGAAALNYGIAQTCAPLIAICNSDDVWVLDKLEKQLAIMNELPKVGACFSNVHWIGRDSKGLVINPYSETFSQPNRSREGWIRFLMENGNALCHPSVLIRREIYEELGLYNEWLRQVPDLEFWLRVLTRFDIFVTREMLVSFRWHGDNTSGPTEQVTRRSGNEHLAVLTSFAINAPRDLLWRSLGFSRADANPSEMTLDIVNALLASGGAYAGMLRQVAAVLLIELTASEVVGDRAKKMVSPESFWGSLSGELGVDMRGIGPGQQVSSTRTADLVRVVLARVAFRLGARWIHNR
ncbi:MAG: glycosyltransferase [Devosia sp.]